MTTSQPTADGADAAGAIVVEAQRLEEDCLYSAKSHFEAAKSWEHVQYSLGIPASALAAIASVSAFNDQSTAAGVVAMVVAALTSISTFLNPSQKAFAHHQAGNRFNGIRVRSRLLHKVESKTAGTPEALVDDLKALIDEREKLTRETPIIPRRAFERARKGIQEGEAEYAIDSGS